MNEIIPQSNHIGMMFMALYNFLQTPFTIDGITFTLFNVLEAGAFFSVISLALHEYFGKFLDIDR